MSLRRWLKKWQSLVLSKNAMTKRNLQTTDERQRAAHETERLDRLRNPRDYRGK